MENSKTRELVREIGTYAMMALVLICTCLYFLYSWQTKKQEREDAEARVQLEQQQRELKRRAESKSQHPVGHRMACLIRALVLRAILPPVHPDLFRLPEAFPCGKLFQYAHPPFDHRCAACRPLLSFGLPTFRRRLFPGQFRRPFLLTPLLLSDGREGETPCACGSSPPGGRGGRAGFG